MTMNNNQEAENLFWVEYGQNLLEELNFKLVLEWLDSGYPSTDRIFIVETIEFIGISHRKTNKLKKIWYFIKRLFKKKRRKE